MDEQAQQRLEKEDLETKLRRRIQDTINQIMNHSPKQAELSPTQHSKFSPAQHSTFSSNNSNIISPVDKSKKIMEEMPNNNKTEETVDQTQKNQSWEKTNLIIHQLQDRITQLEEENKNMKDLLAEKDENGVEVSMKLKDMKLVEKDDQILELRRLLKVCEDKVESLQYEVTNVKWAPALSLLDLPARVKKMQEELHQSPSRLFQIYKLWREMVFWRHELIQQISNTPIDKDNEVFTTVSSMLNVLGSQFECVDALGNHLSEIIWRNFQNAIKISQITPQVLQQCIWIINEVDKAPSTEKEKVIKSTMIQMNCSGDDGLIKYENMKEKLLDEISKSIQGKREAVTSNLLAKSQEKETLFLLNDLHDVKKSLAPLFPIEYNIINYYKKILAQETLEILKSLKEVVNPFDMDTAFRVINWIEGSTKALKDLGLEELSNHFDEVDRYFSSQYIRLIETQMKAAQDRLVRKSYEVKTSKEKFLYTDSVDEIVGYVAQQAKVLQVHLSGQRLREAVHLSIAVLQARQEYQHEELLAINNSNLGTIPDGYLEHICAIINDSDRIQVQVLDIIVQCEERLGSIDADILRNYLHRVGRGFVDLVDEAVDAVSRIMLHDLEPQLSILFTPRWLNNTTAPVLICLATFDDYSTDLERWINQESCLGKVKATSIRRLVRSYVERLLGDGIQFNKDDMEIVALAMAKDYSSLEEYCDKVANLIPNEKERREIKLSLSIIHQLSRFFETKDPALLFAELAREFGRNTGPCLERLISLRCDLSRKQQEQLVIDLDEWRMWGETTIETTPRFRASPMIRESKPTSTVKKAQAMLGKGYQKAKRSSLAKGVHYAATKAPQFLNRKSPT